MLTRGAIVERNMVSGHAPNPFIEEKL